VSSTELSLFSYEILGLVGNGGAGAYDLLRMARSGRMLDWAGESQYYVEPKRLARLGYLDARKEPGKPRERTVYTLTENGREALRAYARTPVSFVPFKSDLLLRLLLADLAGEEPTREAVAGLRDELAELSTQLDAAEARAALLPQREKYLLLVIGFLRDLLRLHVEWIATVEDQLSEDTRRATARSEARRRRP
jgi:DNA-binding PadR family transcriptional regulator